VPVVFRTHHFALELFQSVRQFVGLFLRVFVPVFQLNAAEKKRFGTFGGLDRLESACEMRCRLETRVTRRPTGQSNIDQFLGKLRTEMRASWHEICLSRVCCRPGQVLSRSPIPHCVWEKRFAAPIYCLKYIDSRKRMRHRRSELDPGKRVCADQDALSSAPRHYMMRKKNARSPSRSLARLVPPSARTGYPTNGWILGRYTERDRGHKLRGRSPGTLSGQCCLGGRFYSLPCLAVSNPRTLMRDREYLIAEASSVHLNRRANRIS